MNIIILGRRCAFFLVTLRPVGIALVVKIVFSKYFELQYL